jgi:hypothetical protein
MPKYRNTHEVFVLQVRVPRELVKRLDHFAIDHDVFRPGAVEMLLREGLSAYERKARALPSDGLNRLEAL